MTRVTAMTHVGLVRKRNEDTVVLPGLLTGGSFGHPLATVLEPAEGSIFAVIDGMGGHRGGQEASRLAAQSLLDAPAPADDASLVALLSEANRELYTRMDGSPELRGMGATIAGVCVWKNRASCFNVGDARVYQLSDGYLVRVSTDDRASSDPNAVTQSLGGATRLTAIEPHLAEIELPPEGGKVLLCSDGLSSFASLDDMQEVLASTEGQEAALALLRLVWAAGAEDNVSFVILEG